MSRYYAMYVCIGDFDSTRTAEIKHAAAGEWPFHDRWEDPDDLGNHLECEEEGHLCGGESEEEFVDRLSVAIWKANQRFCTVEVRAIYLEELPSEDHSRDENDYARLMEATMSTIANETNEATGHMIDADGIWQMEELAMSHLLDFSARLERSYGKALKANGLENVDYFAIAERFTKSFLEKCEVRRKGGLD